ncbi:TPA: hypothetical protein ACGPB3_000881 [Streptococcus suis]
MRNLVVFLHMSLDGIVEEAWLKPSSTTQSSCQHLNAVVDWL